MYAIIMRLDEEMVLEKLGAKQLEKMYEKIAKAYIENTGLITYEVESAPEEGYFAYVGDVEYQRIVSTNLAMLDSIGGLKNYLLYWCVYELGENSVGTIKEDLLN